MVDVFLVLVGGAVGAVTRYAIGAMAQRRMPSRAHLGTFVANMAAALLLGFLVEMGTYGHLGVSGQVLLSTGFCGALSTWSTFSHEILAMESARRTAAAGMYLLVTVALGLALSFAGAGIAGALP